MKNSRDVESYFVKYKKYFGIYNDIYNDPYNMTRYALFPMLRMISKVYY